MATQEVTKENLDSLIEQSSILLIDFWADWCGPCKMFAPVFEQASDNHADVVFAKCDTEAQQEVAGAFGIRAIPTLAIFREQVLVFKQSGALPPDALDDVIQQVRNLDMDDVRKKIAEEEAKQEDA